MKPQLLKDVEVAERLGVSVRTVRNWRLTGDSGLPYLRIGKCVRYDPEAISKWLETRVPRSSSDRGPKAA